MILDCLSRGRPFAEYLHQLFCVSGVVVHCVHS